MEEITRAAKATYEKLSASEKQEILNMFNSMDQDGDNKISLQEFKTYFATKGDQAKAKAKANSNLFNLIDRNRDKTLAFEEALTLIYISESGRPVCDGCGKFIQALFFTCTDCHYNRPDEDGYNVCIACYETGNFSHDHTEFLDNYRLFAEMKTKDGAGSATSQTNGSLFSDETLLTTGTNQPRTRKRDMFMKGFTAIKDIFTGSVIGAGLATTVTDTAGANETQEETY
ncbi:hypothetical protein L6164_013004 [Bauhinia variegata]|uniref:Uncharacterized protein n=1 Tax=Bauhinia variegata TaxID=167791 RepID=A0ACB9PDB7_BAUVA|nr:hypothetical protein L6164_013004 [Bauhinia variegata]